MKTDDKRTWQETNNSLDLLVLLYQYRGLQANAEVESAGFAFARWTLERADRTNWKVDSPASYYYYMAEAKRLMRDMKAEGALDWWKVIKIARNCANAEAAAANFEAAQGAYEAELFTQAKYIRAHFKCPLT